MKLKRLIVKARRFYAYHVEPISRDQWVIFLSFLVVGVGIGMGA